MYRYCFGANGKCRARYDDKVYESFGGDEEHKQGFLKHMAGKGGTVVEDERDLSRRAISYENGVIVVGEELLKATEESLNACSNINDINAWLHARFYGVA